MSMVPAETGPRRRRRPEHTRSALVAAAAELFAERGVDGVRVQEVAARAGVTTGALYRHFDGKAELLAEALDTVRPAGLDHVITAHESGTDLATALREFARTTLDGPLDDHQALLLEALVAARRDPNVARAMRQRLAQRLDVLTELVRADGHTRDDLAPDAIAWLAYLISLGSLLSRTLEPPTPAETAWEHLLHTITEALTRSP